MRRPADRLGEHQQGIANNKEKAIPIYFREIKNTMKDIVFVPFRKVKTRNPWILKGMETKLINEYNLIDTGINRIL